LNDPNPDFKVLPILDAEYLRKGMRQIYTVTTKKTKPDNFNTQDTTAVAFPTKPV